MTHVIAHHPLHKSNSHFASPKGKHFGERAESHFRWTRARIDSGYWPYARWLESSPLPSAAIASIEGVARQGINLAIQDYLGLSTHDQICEAAIKVTRDFGVHSAGSAMLLGNNPLSRKLEGMIAALTHMDHVLLFPTGWAAGFGVVKGLVRDYDHIVLDRLSHACLQEGAAAATRNLHRYTHLDVAEAARMITEIRANDSSNAILVIAEGLYSMDSDSPDIPGLQEVCTEFNATLLVDVAHDLGSSGDNGTGQLGLQNMLGKVDIVMGSFSKAFASNGGFIATNDERIKTYLRWFANPHIFSNALSPVQCAVVCEAIEIVMSREGEERRESLQRLAKGFRDALRDKGMTVLGAPSAIVPVLIGRESFARVAARAVSTSGTFTNLVEFPAVPLGGARFRCQLMATHSELDLAQAAKDISGAITIASRSEPVCEPA